MARPSWPPLDCRHRKQHGLQPDATCALCDQNDESTDHLLASCPFTREIWTRLLTKAGLQHLALAVDSTLAEWWLSTCAEVPETFQRAFDSLVLAVSWVIWKERNGQTFNSFAMTTSQLLGAIADDLDDYIGASYMCLTSLFAGAG